MKKLTIGILLFILTSCENHILTESKIYEIRQNKNCYCNYSIYNAFFIDTCDKYNVGDIVYITKKR